MRGDHFLVTSAKPIRNGDARSIEGHVIPSASVANLRKIRAEIAKLKGELATPNYSQLIAEVGENAVEDMLTASEKVHSDIISRAKKDSFVVPNIYFVPPSGNLTTPTPVSIKSGHFAPLAKIKKLAKVIDDNDDAILKKRYPGMHGK